MASRIPEKLALVSGVACASLGFIVIVGWHWGLTLLVQVRSEYRPMPYGSAAGFLLAGLTLVAIVRERERAARYLTGAIVGVVIAANSGALGLDLSFEHLFGLANPGVSAAWFGRMPPNATLNFMLVAVALFDITRPRPRWSFIAIGGSIVTAIGVTALLGYATNLAGAYSWQGLPPMAIHGATGFITIGAVLVVSAWISETSGEEWVPRWAPALIGIAAATSSLVLWQALLQEGAHTLALATLSIGVTVAAALAISVYFAQTARRELRRAQTAMRQLTSEIAERQRIERTLHAANQELAVADRKKDEFLATLAHELRNPLAPIRFALRLLETANGENGTARRSLAVVGRQVTQLVRLIDDLLDVSRIARNKIHLRRERVTLTTLVQAIVETAQPQIAAGGHHLTVTEHGDAVLDADPTRVVQIVTNLLNNAAKFTPAGGHIALSSETAGGRAVITVSDDGIGIAADALPHIFEMFHQGDKSPSQSAGGLGIGLCLARQLAEMHGGTISAFSDGPNRGATFRVDLPVAEGIPRDVAGSRQRSAAARSALSVLIVDDNVDAAETLDLLLQHDGHRTCVVHDGRAALDAAARSVPQVVLLDIGLPVMNGYEVARELRALYGPGIYLVAITGWGQPEDRRQAREAGFDCHLTKPADPETVMRILAAVAHGIDCDGCSECLQTPRTREMDGRPYRPDISGIDGQV